jgi:hypothetical protein
MQPVGSGHDVDSSEKTMANDGNRDNIVKWAVTLW